MKLFGKAARYGDGHAAYPCRRRWRRVGVLATATACVVGLAACGGSKSGNAATSGGGCKSGGKMTLGFLGGFSGNESFLGPDMLKGVNAALAEVNASGGILNCKVVLTTADTANDPVDAIPAYRKVVSRNVPLILGPTSEGESALSAMKQAQVPTFIQGGTTALDHVKNNPYFWRTTPSDSAQADAMAAYAISRGWKKAALVFTNDTGSTPLVAPLETAYKQDGGTFVNTESLVPDEASYQSAVSKVVASKPQVVFFQQDPQTAGTFFSEVVSAGFDGKTNWLGTNVEATSDVFKAVGPTVATTHYFTTNGTNETGVEAATFNHWYQAVNHTATPANLAPEAYDGTIIAALAMEKAHSTSGSAIASAIPEVSNPPGTPVYGYKQGLALIKQGKKINYQGAASLDDFDQYHNVFGPFGVYVFNKGGSVNQIATVTNSGHTWHVTK